MRIGTTIGIEMDGSQTLDDIVDEVRQAAAAGLTAVWAAQMFSWDALTTLAVAGGRVPGIRLGTSVVPTYPRHPLVLASQALTVQAAVGNRLTLGLGASFPFVVEDAFGYSFERPARHVREYITALAPLLGGETVTYQGETLSAAGTVTVRGAEPPTLLLAALGPAMLRVAGELTAGTVTAWTGPATIADYIVPTIHRAAAGRPIPQVVVGLPVSVTADEDAARADIAERYALAADLPSYRAMLEREGVHGIGDVVIAGDEAAVERELWRLRDAGATEIIATPFGSPEDRARTVGVLAGLVSALTPAPAMAAAPAEDAHSVTVGAPPAP